MNLRGNATHLLASLLLLLAAALAPDASSEAASAGVHVTGIRHWTNPTYTRVVIDLDRKPNSYSYRLLKRDPSINKPRRLYVDITRASIGKTLLRSIPIHDGLLKMARTGQYNRRTVRVVLDIESIEDYKIFPIEEPYRIVIDVTGKKGAIGASARTRPAVRTPGASPSLSRQLGLKVRRVVIDAGHGGKDPGAVGRRGLKEKDVTLKLARLVRDRLKGKVDEVILTRSRDVFIPLEERTAIANKRDADLFVSIHINASPRRSASGIETYILDFSSSDDSRRVAARENATSTRSVSDLEFILKDLMKTAKTNDSSLLASTVQTNLVRSLASKYRGIPSNGVKGAPFYVLVGTEMPSVLVEVSFLSNSKDERRLRERRYLELAAEGITKGILNYIKQSNDMYGCHECSRPAS
ncbi:MAG: N-acetylmuramoyl-L-alanine amidase [Thermodesulfobacteriota bacterium]